MRWLFRVGASSGRDGLDGCDDDRGGHGRRRCLRQARQTSPRSSVHGWSSVPHVRASEVMAFVITATCDRCPEPPARRRGCLAADPWRWMELHHKLIQSCVKMLEVDDEGSDLRWWWWQASERASEREDCVPSGGSLPLVRSPPLPSPPTTVDHHHHVVHIRITNCDRS